jgi:hypothetical protein
MTQEELIKVKSENLALVKGGILSNTWPDHIIYDIILNERDGVQVPHVIGKNEKNPNDREYSKPLDTWFQDNPSK